MGVTAGLRSREQLQTTVTDTIIMVQLHIVCMTLLSVLLVLRLDTVEASCTFEDKEVCEGKIVKEIGKRLVKICVDGKMKTKPRKTILPWTGAREPGSCMWYGEVLCDGDVVQDLYRWWFLSKCSKSKMSVVSRSWLEVISDKRYKANKI